LHSPGTLLSLNVRALNGRRLSSFQRSKTCLSLRKNQSDAFVSHETPTERDRGRDFQFGWSGSGYTPYRRANLSFETDAVRLDRLAVSAYPVMLKSYSSLFFRLNYGPRKP
jgi:hypothetical protein